MLSRNCCLTLIEEYKCGNGKENTTAHNNGWMSFRVFLLILLFLLFRFFCLCFVQQQSAIMRETHLGYYTVNSKNVILQFAAVASNMVASLRLELNRSYYVGCFMATKQKHKREAEGKTEIKTSIAHTLSVSL